MSERTPFQLTTSSREQILRSAPEYLGGSRFRAAQPEGFDQRCGLRRASSCWKPEPITCVTPA
ncbi:MAG TPA: hypothetical protein VK358_04230, partial [Longimicrobium sp.]|nr:hypothetical protein [Longimicrobium sp.]